MLALSLPACYTKIHLQKTLKMHQTEESNSRCLQITEPQCANCTFNEEHQKINHANATVANSHKIQNSYIVYYDLCKVGIERSWVFLLLMRMKTNHLKSVIMSYTNLFHPFQDSSATLLLMRDHFVIFWCISSFFRQIKAE